eukprot:g38844.t1
MQYLLREFTTIRQEDYNEELIYEGLPLMFDILRNDALNQQLASIFIYCYGNAPIPSIPELKRMPPARLATGEVSEDWQVANGVPLFKKENRDNQGNYRL